MSINGLYGRKGDAESAMTLTVLGCGKLFSASVVCGIART
jgi:hypothetical protein